MEGFLVWIPPPSWKFELSPLYFPLEILTFESHNPLKFSNDIPWGGFEYKK